MTTKRLVRCSNCGVKVRLAETECPYSCVCSRLISWDGIVLTPLYQQAMLPKPILIVNGPGTELMNLLQSIGITPHASCSRCKAMMQKMNAWGVEGCREHFAVIVTSMEDDAKKYSWGRKVAAAGRALIEGLAFRVNPLNPIPDLVNEAIRRVETNPSC